MVFSPTLNVISQLRSFSKCLSLSSHLLIFSFSLLLLNIIRMVPSIFTFSFNVLVGLSLVGSISLILIITIQTYNLLVTLQQSLNTYQRNNLLSSGGNSRIIRYRLHEGMTDGEISSLRRRLRQSTLTE
ncbi:C3 protein [Sweet potato symptomless virus 1]|uniref:C3 protein n=1 Tax=Sweet potato symptomless virus 1 TaxID=603333 RepID=A0A2Z2GUZ5_9GEMI|nr:C3 protein [Sweet potato symptomless virus 1]ARR74890.1 C3 protein [Sweet potato symptomless virus 1]ARR74900.1 C3 protein [Sweet potato symptomless virus 1]QFU85152.1 C3 protein [Sweet potato symptomless virus 1]